VPIAVEGTVKNEACGVTAVTGWRKQSLRGLAAVAAVGHFADLPLILTALTGCRKQFLAYAVCLSVASAPPGPLSPPPQQHIYQATCCMCRVSLCCAPPSPFPCNHHHHHHHNRCGSSPAVCVKACWPAHCCWRPAPVGAWCVHQQTDRPVTPAAGECHTAMIVWCRTGPSKQRMADSHMALHASGL
jgi:hypothetical protein